MQNTAPFMTEKNKYVLRLADPKELEVHPAVALVPEMSTHAFAQLEKAIAEAHAILQPLICAENKGRLLILDGRHRHKVALKLKLLVPVVVNNEADPLSMAITSAIARRQLTRSGIVCTLFEAHPQLADHRSARGGKLRRKRVGARNVEVLKDFDAPSYSVLAERYEVPREYFSRLAAIWDSATDAEWKEVRGRILSGQTEIPNEYAGFCGGIPTKGGKRPAPDYARLLRRSFLNELPERVRAWNKLDTVEKGKILEEFGEKTKKFPRDFCKDIGALLVARAEDDSK
jgi:hypothetical protein